MWVELQCIALDLVGYRVNHLRGLGAWAVGGTQNQIIKSIRIQK